MKITIFGTASKNEKFAKSPYDDNSFIFETIEVQTTYQAFQLLVNNFCLNIALDLKGPGKSRRLKTDLEPHIIKTFDHLLFDFECKSEFNKNMALDYFKSTQCTIGQSRSYDGVNNFNLKGIIKTAPMSLKELKVLQAKIQKELSEYGKYTTDTLRITYYTAPLNKDNILLDNPNGSMLMPIGTNVTDYYNNIDLDCKFNITSKETTEICKTIFKNLGFILVDINANGSIKYTKDSENYIWYPNNPYIMNHTESYMSVNIWKEAIKYEPTFDITPYIDYKADIVVDRNFTEIKSELDSIVEAFLFKHNGALTLRAPMGSGKTTFIDRIIEAALERDFKVAIITNRVTLAEDYKRKYKKFLYYKDYTDAIKAKDSKNSNNISGEEAIRLIESYSNVDNVSNLNNANTSFVTKTKKPKIVRSKGKSLICQYDSFRHFDLDDYDLIILDEFMSLLMHTRSALNSKTENLIKFYTALNKKVVVADAFLSKYIVDNMFTKPLNVVSYTKNNTELYSCNDSNTFYTLIKNALDSNKKITISTTSIKVVDIIKQMCYILNKKIIIFNKETGSVSKNIIYDKIRSKEALDCDVFIYTPVLTVGVNILNDVDIHFHYDSASSTDVISSLQMLGRARFSKKIIYYVMNKKYNACINYDLLKTTVEKKPKEHTDDSKDRDVEYKRGTVKNLLYHFHVPPGKDYQELSHIGKACLKVDVFNNMTLCDYKKSFDILLSFNFSKIPIELRKIGGDILKLMNIKIQNSKDSDTF
ncbi:DEAD/DEAH box helicase family protein [Campylobacter jejuni]|uniref:DEAD/DEAH box helicase family protein n=1 Tax=Campylobacter jejuni TaxID=197 RepID=UPI001930EF4D|nr:DEAD/DEAH box helicase family protein [Campylobacter jejuni]